jgi:hypothetical protein
MVIECAVGAAPILRGLFGLPRVFRTGSFVANSCGELPVLELVSDLSWRLVPEF